MDRIVMELFRPAATTVQPGYARPEPVNMEFLENVINPFQGHQHYQDPNQDEDVLSQSQERQVVPMPPKMDPVTHDELNAYISGIKQLTKRKRDLHPIIEATSAKIEDLRLKVKEDSKYTEALSRAIRKFPRDLVTPEIKDAQDRLIALMTVELDKHALMSKHTIDSLEADHAKLVAYLVDMNNAAAAAGAEQVAPNACPICLTSQIEVALDPCGHTLCSKCTTKNMSMSCPMCRNHYGKKIRLYFSV